MYILMYRGIWGYDYGQVSVLWGIKVSKAMAIDNYVYYEAPRYMGLWILASMYVMRYRGIWGYDYGQG